MLKQNKKMHSEQRSKSGTKTQLQYAIDGRLGLILDSTARDIPRIESEKSSIRLYWL